MSDSPKLFLAMDNCFAIKRWITPAQWFPVIKEMGATSIEASTDNEVDPLFLPASYMDDWVAEVKALEKEHGIRVRSFFTGYQTYRTAGLAHPDQRVRTKLVEDWYKPLICKAGQLDADIGFSFHAVCEEELGSPERYWEAIRRSNECFAHLAAFAWEHNRVKLCCEQMYAPYQPPFTIESARRMLKDVYGMGGRPFYIANDVGHMVGQRRFRMPDAGAIAAAVGQVRSLGRTRDIWLGPASMYKKVYDQAGRPAGTDEAFSRAAARELRDDFPYMFSFGEGDGDPYAWIRELGAYSPIVHMQQTDGVRSSHAPFTAETNRTGIIAPGKVLRAMKESFDREEEEGMPPKTDRVTLAFELFISNVSYPHDYLEDLKETVAHWKRYIPEDGMTLDEAVEWLERIEK
ncbi:MAG: hypothetical protein GX647_00135 [Clostridiales bacterium]|jgi:sugar phosphate isomerase/epimerase|nr:hypothetical protein [Clostridiales bacterium]